MLCWVEHSGLGRLVVGYCVGLNRVVLRDELLGAELVEKSGLERLVVECSVGLNGVVLGNELLSAVLG